jgi:hypothetical protein
MANKTNGKPRKRRELGIDCSEDIGIRATFFCTRCKKPFCEDCLGREDGKTIHCLACAAIAATKKKKNSNKEEKSKIATPLNIIFLVLVIFAGFFFIDGNDSSQLKKELLAPLTSAQEADLAKCKENLQSLSMLISDYQLTRGHDPKELEDVVLLKKNTSLLLEPVEENEYGLESIPGKGLVVSCPNPYAHNLENLYAQPGGPAVAVQDPDQ